MKKKPVTFKPETVGVVIPTYNEKENIVRLMDEIYRSAGKVRIFVVDDNSPDGTQNIVQQYTKKYPKTISLLKRKSKSGRGGAVLAGFTEAMKNPIINYFVEMDADFSHNPKLIKSLVRKCMVKRVALGSRYVSGASIKNWSLTRKITSRLSNFYIRLVLGVPVHDCTNGYRCYSRDAVKIVLSSNIKNKGFIALSETLYLLYKRGFDFAEVPFDFIDREKGKSNATFSEIIGSIPAILKIRYKYCLK